MIIFCYLNPTCIIVIISLLTQWKCLVFQTKLTNILCIIIFVLQFLGWFWWPTTCLITILWNVAIITRWQSWRLNSWCIFDVSIVTQLSSGVCVSCVDLVILVSGCCGSSQVLIVAVSCCVVLLLIIHSQLVIIHWSV